MPKPLFNVVLLAPEIPGNTGSIGRTCLALGARLILIHPLAFDISEKAVRRAGLDYWKHVDIVEYDNFEAFIEAEKPSTESLFFFSKKREGHWYYDAGFTEGAYLVFGRETTGLPDDILEKYAERCFALPMYSEHIRSLNLSNAATAVCYEALRQIKF
jgi:tRNA (cytidine/uridine-2'-O-)-methyltransferase